jgi:hypothetical protein
MAEQDDIWYAANITEIIRPPQQMLETFGATQIHYVILAELMDQPNQVRIREGTLYSERPQIITPSHFAEQLLDGFGDKAQEYADWLTSTGQTMRILKFGLQFRREVDREEIVHGEIDVVSKQVCDAVEDRGRDPAVVLIGADELWEISLLKFGVEYIQQSAPHNIRDIQQRASERRDQVDNDIESAFRDAVRDHSCVNYLGELLRKTRRFEQYEDRFYALVRRIS